MQDLWTYDKDLTVREGLEGLDVEATDGKIGSVDEATTEVGASYIVVDTGPWIFGKKVLIPASAIVRVDVENRALFLRLTQDQIKDSPEFDPSDYRTPAYRERVGAYYDPMF